MLQLRERLEKPLCRTIGCTSWFANYWEWPHRWVCVPWTSYLFKPGYQPKIDPRYLESEERVSITPSQGLAWNQYTRYRSGTNVPDPEDYSHPESDVQADP